MVACIGDFSQIVPIVPHGSRVQLVEGSKILPFLLWNKFQVSHPTQNLRLIGLSDLLDTTRGIPFINDGTEFLRNQKTTLI